MEHAVEILGVRLVMESPEVIVFVRPSPRSPSRGRAEVAVTPAPTVGVRLRLPAPAPAPESESCGESVPRVAPAVPDPSSAWVRHYI